MTHEARVPGTAARNGSRNGKVTWQPGKSMVQSGR